MKKFLVVLCIVCMMFSTMAFANTETEPNDDPDKANGSYDVGEKVLEISMVINESDKVDWFKITPQLSGELIITVSYKGVRVKVDLDK